MFGIVLRNTGQSTKMVASRCAFGIRKDANPRSGCLLMEDGLEAGFDVRCAGDTDAVIERVWSMKLKRDGVGCTSGFP